MSKVVGLLAALAALGAGVFGQVDPTTCLWRATLAFFLGWAGATVWQGLYVAASKPALPEEPTAGAVALDQPVTTTDAGGTTGS